MRERIVLIGAGSAMFTRGLVADLLKRRWEAELALVDIDPDALAMADGLAKKMVAASGAPVKVSAFADRRKALPGATAVVTTIAVGGRRAWERDVVIPRKYGIFQPVGDSVMPGGTSRAMRMIPQMVAIARDVLELAPDALFFNYSNPMAPICRAVRKATGADMVGLCHGVFHTADKLAAALGVPTTEFGYTAVGMNHLTWLMDMKVRGKDATAQLAALAAKNVASTDPADSPFSWRLYRLFGAFPAVFDRHVTEFFPHFFADGKYYGHSLGVDAFDIDKVIAHGEEKFQQMRRDALSPAPLSAEYMALASGEHEQVLDIIADIRRDSGVVYSANFPNRGQVPNLPPDAIVESPARATARGLVPVAQPALASGLAGTLASRFAWVEVVVEAALEGSREKFVQALVIDGAVDSIDTAAALADDLIAEHARYLPQFA